MGIIVNGLLLYLLPPIFLKISNKDGANVYLKSCYQGDRNDDYAIQRYRDEVPDLSGIAV